MDGFNQVTLIGSVGNDAEVKFLKETSQVAKFSVATNRSYKDKDGNKKTQTEWHNVEVWNETAKFAGNYVKKGTLILVVGELRYEKFEDKDGKPQTRAKIHATKIQLLPKGAGSNQNGASTGASASAGDSAAAKQQAEEYASTTSAEFVGSSADDDLPF